MRTAFLALTFLCAVVASCGVDPPRSETTQLDELGGADPAAIHCPTICGEGTLCQLPDGSCGEVCNACFCTVRHGTVVSSCPNAASAPAGDDSLIIGGGACGNTTCQAGTHCCNASCGICVGPGGVCTQQICSDPT
jgi:hypothetical protein